MSRILHTIDLLTNNLAEVIGIDDIKAKLDSLGPDEKLNIYWGTAPTKPPHVAYFLPLLKLRDFVRTGKARVTILIADVHSYLDEGFEAIPKVHERADYYEFVLKEMLMELKVHPMDYEIVRGSKFQMSQSYIMDLLEFTTLITVKQAQRAGTEVVKNSKKDPSLSKIIYPLMQCVDEQALEADVQLGGSDQRKIFVLSRDYASRRGRKKCSYFINPLIPSFDKKGKMSASSASKLELFDDNDVIRKKISNAWCVEGNSDVTTDPVLALMKYIIFPVRGALTIEREEKYGGNVEYTSFTDLESDWVEQKLSSIDLKNNLAAFLIDLISPIRDALGGNQLYKLAYE